MTGKYQLKIKSLNKESLNLYKKFLEKIFAKMNVKYYLFNLPTNIKRITLLKSPHVNKSAREQFEIKRYSCSFTFNCSNKINIEKIFLLNKPAVLTFRLKSI